jgi:glycosyltransferase involved in cell wall biosynthesis
MKILVIMKRFTSNMDLPSMDFGRQISLFRNENADFLCPDYKKMETKTIKRGKTRYFIRPFSIAKFRSFCSFAKKLCRENKYDAIIGSSDPIFGIFGYFLAKQFNAKYVYDAQDDYGTYTTYKIPFIPVLDRHVMRHSDAVLSTSETLTEKLRRIGANNVHTIVEGVDLDEVKILDKKDCRKKLNLPQGKKILTYIGLISKLKGGDFIFKAFSVLKKEYPDLYLLLVGKIASDVKADIGERIIYKPFLGRKEYVMALNASDVLMLPNSRNSFSYYSFPYKLLEYMAVNKPIVASDIGNIGCVLKKFRASLYKPDDMEDFLDKFRKQAAIASINYRDATKKYTWQALAKETSAILRKITQ